MDDTANLSAFRGADRRTPRGASGLAWRFAATLAFWLAMLSTASAQAPAHVRIEHDAQVRWTLTAPTIHGEDLCSAPCELTLAPGEYVMGGHMGPDHERVVLAPGETLTLALDHRRSDDAGVTAFFGFIAFGIGMSIPGLLVAMIDPQLSDAGLAAMGASIGIAILGASLSIILLPTGSPRVTLTPVL